VNKNSVLTSGMQISLVKMTGIHRSPLCPRKRKCALQTQMFAKFQ
jgi:hypothetical protein